MYNHESVQFLINYLKNNNNCFKICFKDCYEIALNATNNPNFLL